MDHASGARRGVTKLKAWIEVPERRLWPVADVESYRREIWIGAARDSRGGNGVAAR